MKRIGVQLRDKLVPLTVSPDEGEKEYNAFCRVFEDYFKDDLYVCEKKKKNFLIFEYKDEEFNTFMEVPKNCERLPANFIKVRFSPIESPQKVNTN